MHKSVKLVVGFKSQKHGAGLSKTIQNTTTTTTKTLQLFFSVKLVFWFSGVE